MGKRLIIQRRGRGSPNFRTPDHVHVAPAKYPLIPFDQTFKGVVADFIHDPGRWVPLAEIELENGLVFYVPAVEGMYKGQVIEVGPAAKPVHGNILPIGSIPEGTQICNIEKNPGDGGRFVRSSGTYAIIVGRAGGKTQVQLPSGKIIEVPNEARAMVGVVAGGGRLEKPLLKAGASYYKWSAKSRWWPRVRGVAMNAAFHPHGGGSHQHVGRPSTISRMTPPGRKVGHIAARRTGRRKG
ncbi:50S ribosomal protein L2 [Thermosphaera chiliense]|uniref:Large ribosomal subunit protein uL2 n=1 Tax=Thermosphaera chiliense TaxID=3402707 RepID=A0A7M1UT11_9CREN|nr:50S ribosomal protein L2 [Thermosphaera aggregans]QOR94727.1 50S ribosomal protein L2 [Thermosphaera aggregans]